MSLSVERKRDLVAFLRDYRATLKSTTGGIHDNVKPVATNDVKEMSYALETDTFTSLESHRSHGDVKLSRKRLREGVTSASNENITLFIGEVTSMMTIYGDSEQPSATAAGETGNCIYNFI